MNEMQIFSKPEFGMIKALTADDGTPWFNAVDVCRVLDLKNVTDALQRHVEADDLVKTETKQGGKIRKVNFVNESGLYSLVLCSKKSNAKAFKRWVTGEVLPSLRKNGAYLTPSALKKSLKDPDFVKELVQTLANEQKKTAELSARIAEQKPRVLFSKAVEGCENSVLVRDLARILRQNGVEIGEKRLYVYLRENGYLCTYGTSYNRPTQSAMDKGLFEVKARPITKPDGTVITVYTTMVTGKGQVYFVNNLVRLTESELAEYEEMEGDA